MQISFRDRLHRAATLHPDRLKPSHRDPRGKIARKDSLRLTIDRRCSYSYLLGNSVISLCNFSIIHISTKEENPSIPEDDRWRKFREKLRLRNEDGSWGNCRDNCSSRRRRKREREREEGDALFSTWLRNPAPLEMARKFLALLTVFLVGTCFRGFRDIHRYTWNRMERRQVTRDRKSISFSRSVCRRDRFESVGKVEVAEMAAMSRPGVGREARTGPRVNGSLRPFVVCVVCEHIDAQIEVRYEARSPSRATFSL